MNEYKGTKYPLDVAVYRSKQTLSVESHLILATSANGESPKTIFGKFSRYVLTIINENRVAVSGNIHPLDFVGPVAETSKAFFAEEKRRTFAGAPAAPAAPQTSGGVQATCQVPFVSGNLKGKTPLQVLMENPNMDLSSQYNWLAERVGQFPNNQKIMNAINEAVSLRNNGLLAQAAETAAQAPTAGGMIPVYETGVRPNVHKEETRNSVRMSPVYETGVYWTFGNKYPVEVVVTTYFAPVEKKPDGRLNVIKSQYDRNSLLKNSIRMTADEWMKIVRLVEFDVERFNMLNAANIENDAWNTYQANRNGNN